MRTTIVTLSLILTGPVLGTALGQAAPAAADRGQTQPGNGTAVEPTRPGAPGSGFLSALAALTPEERTYFQHNATLSNPFFEGRAPGLRGNVLAAEYCEFFFRSIGLEPLFEPKAAGETIGDGGEPPEGATATAESARTYRQPFRAGTRMVLTEQVFEARAGDGAEMALRLGSDFVVTPPSADGAAEGEVVFVGYSIERGPDDYSTYLTADGKDKDEADLGGKIALMLRLEPKDERGRSRWAEAREGAAAGWSDNARLSGKIRRAVQRGAAAVIVVSPPGAEDPRLNVLDDLRTATRVMGRVQEVPVVQASIPAAERLLKASGHDLGELTRRADARGEIVPLSGLRVSVRVGTKQEPTMSDNVAGVLRGRGALADEFIVIGGHFDHVGYGAFGSRDSSGQGKLHPGADDNASGTAGVLLAAEIMVKRYAALPAEAAARSIIFIVFNAEEGGLIGSRHFVRNPPAGVAASSIYAMLNMDMIGRLRDDLGLEVSGVATAEGFRELIKPLLEAFPTKVGMLPGGAGPSDHASFYSAGVPVLAFFTGFHADYHMPTDFFHGINTPGAVRVTGLVCDLASLLAARAEPLTFTRARGPSSARDLGGDNPTGQARTAIRVQFGIRPGTYEDDKPGIPVGDVTEGSAAAEAGIKAGDRMIRWNGEEVADVQAWMRHLRAANPGDIVHVVVLRNGEEITIPVTLRARDNPGER